MVSERYFIGGAIIFSILLHLAAVPLYDKFVKQDKPKKPDPIEVSYIPPKSEPPAPPAPQPKPQEPLDRRPLPPIPDYTDNSERDTTFDERLVGGQNQANNDKSQPKPEQTASLPKIKPVKPLAPKTAPTDTKNTDTEKPSDELSLKANNADNMTADTETNIPPPNIAGLMDTKDVIERIANQKKEQPPGQDTASYNKFEGKYASYFAKFKSSVYQVWNYPMESIMNRETGVVQVSFSILKDGSIVNIKVLRTSGYPALDREVMRVLKSMRQTPLPSSYNLEQLNIDDANFIYTIGKGWDIF